MYFKIGCLHTCTELPRALPRSIVPLIHKEKSFITLRLEHKRRRPLTGVKWESLGKKNVERKAGHNLGISIFFFFQNEDIPSFGASDPQYILGVDILSHGLSIWKWLFYRAKPCGMNKGQKPVRFHAIYAKASGRRKSRLDHGCYYLKFQIFHMFGLRRHINLWAFQPLTQSFREYLIVTYVVVNLEGNVGLSSYVLGCAVLWMHGCIEN